MHSFSAESLEIFIYHANLTELMSKSVKIGIIGVGRWGKNYLRTLNELENADVQWVCATRENTIKEALKANNNPSVKTTTNYKDILNDEEIDAVAIASNGATHYKLAKDALQSNKHVIVEKPLAFHSQDVKELIRISKERKKILMVGHLHIYNPGIKKLKADIDKGLFGKINFIHLSHFGNGPVRSDLGVIWDFFPHSISILLHLLGKMPLSVSVNGASYIKNGIEDIATMDMAFPNKIFATSAASWLYPLKKMDVVVAGEKLYATFDDYAKIGKLKYYDSRPSIVNGRVILKDNRYISPLISDAKPLTEQLKHFLNCVIKNEIPLTDGYEGLKVVSVLEAAQKSLKNNGLNVKAAP